MDVRYAIEIAVLAFEAGGIAAIVLTSLVALVRFSVLLIRGQAGALAYRALREGIGRGILLGLELLVAADIIRTVAIDPTFANVGVLGLIVLVRTFLSWSLEVEITGEWPWQRSPRAATAAERTAGDAGAP